MNAYLGLVSLAGLILLPAGLALAASSSSSASTSSLVFLERQPAARREVALAGAGCEIQKCGSTLDPVCGSDGRTHGSECHLQNRACRYGQPLSLVHKGSCKRRTSAQRWPPARDACQSVRCMAGAKCREIEGRPKCVCTPNAATSLAPICASDGNTYGSIEDMHYSNCENRTANEKVRDSACK